MMMGRVIYELRMFSALVYLQVSDQCIRSADNVLMGWQSPGVAMFGELEAQMPTKLFDDGEG